MRPLRIKIWMTTMLIAFLGLVSVVDAQHFSVGPKVAFVSSGFSGQDANVEERRNGYAVGAFLGISPGEYFIFQPEILFVQKGAENRFPVLNIREEIKLNYIQMPIMFKLRIPIQEQFYPYFEVGPFMAFSTRSTYSITDLDSGFEVTDSRNYKNADVGGVFGAGADIEGDNIIFNIGVRYDISALNLRDDDEAPDFRNNAFTINTGLGFKF